MPNHCTNSVTIEGENLDKILPNPFTFNGVLPRPKEMEEGGWYEWDCMNWGTKWDVCDADEGVHLNDDETPLEEGTDLVTFDFTTAWSPPIALFCHLVKMHPELKVTLSYMEPGMSFAGYAVITKDGVKHYNVKNYRYHSFPHEQLDAIAKAHPPLDWIMEDLKNMDDDDDDDETPDEMEVLEDEDVEPLDDFLLQRAFQNALQTTMVTVVVHKKVEVPKDLELALRYTGPGYELVFDSSTKSFQFKTLDGRIVMEKHIIG